MEEDEVVCAVMSGRWQARLGYGLGVTLPVGSLLYILIGDYLGKLKSQSKRHSSSLAQIKCVSQIVSQ